MVRHPAHEPPFSELPAVLATPDLVGRADHIALAIPSLLVYSTGIELLILCRYREGRIDDPTEDRQALAHRLTESARDTSDQLPRLVTVNGTPVELLGGRSDRHGFTYRAWSLFRSEVDGTDLVISLSWPGVPTTTVTVDAPQLADVVQRVVTLWP
jgi:hypothetical protein